MSERKCKDCMYYISGKTCKECIYYIRSQIVTLKHVKDTSDRESVEVKNNDSNT